MLGVALLGAAGPAAQAQALARPGWAGSGLTATQWWRNAVVLTVSPRAAEPTLPRLAAELDDLQVLGVDAVLLRGVDASTAPSPEQGRVAPAYGTLEQFDSLLAESSQRRIRVIVELPSTLAEGELAGAARFWLSRGVSGLFLGQGSSDPTPPATGAGAQSDSSTAVAAGVASSGAAAAGYSGTGGAVLRGVLRGYVGDRVLMAEAVGQAVPAAGGPEMLLRTIRGFGPGPAVDVAAVRTSLSEARTAGARGGPVSVVQLDPAGEPAHGDSARARLAVLAMVPGGIALREGESGAGPEAEGAAARKAQAAKDEAALAAATSPAAVGNVKRAIARREAGEPPRFSGDAVFSWAERMIGLHRGSPAMLRGQQSLLNFDSDGALVSVWRAETGPVLCAIVNLRDSPVELSLTSGFSGMRLRGSFLRPVARTDAGMGAMPLGRVKLPAYGVYLGELGR